MRCCTSLRCSFRYSSHSISSEVLHPFTNLMNQSDGFVGVSNLYERDRMDVDEIGS